MSSIDSNIDTALKQMIASILDSEVYREYDRQRRRVKEFPELKAQIDEFRARNYEMQTNENTEIDQIDEFERKYESFREDPLVSDFLAAELAFCRMMQEIGLRVTEAIDFE